jgi:hypothetical protein
MVVAAYLLEQTQYPMLNVYLVFKSKVQVSEKYVQTTK